MNRRHHYIELPIAIQVRHCHPPMRRDACLQSRTIGQSKRPVTHIHEHGICLLVRGRLKLLDQVIDVRLAAKHPILNGVPPMELMDETYKGQWFGPGLIPLLETDHPKSDRLVAWVSPYKNSRVIVIQLGHDRWSHLHPGYRQLVHNAIMWAAQR